ncbi:hypothetical protein J6590_043293 [Homalodisca vitripennis]|nr:hypothetical protein J6590_043293 [Homalodisca vitripennis]
MSGLLRRILVVGGGVGGSGSVKPSSARIVKTSLRGGRTMGYRQEAAQFPHPHPSVVAVPWDIGRKQLYSPTLIPPSWPYHGISAGSSSIPPPSSLRGGRAMEYRQEAAQFLHPHPSVVAVPWNIDRRQLNSPTLIPPWWPYHGISTGGGSIPPPSSLRGGRAMEYRQEAAQFPHPHPGY